MWLTLIFGLVIVNHAASESGIKCGECDPEKCKPPSEQCLAGLVKDLCGCCYVCGRREGEICDGTNLPLPYRNRGYGPCGEHLECKPRTDLAPEDPPEAQCVCVKTEVLCGNDGKTYENECQMTEARYRNRDGLKAIHRGPCKSAPMIVTPPEDVSNVTGGNVVMSCEAMGYPIPSIEWRLDRGDGDSIPLPTDDPKIAVQSRGGPKNYEITGWLQMLSIEPKDEAIYYCIAKNEEGESSASARLTVLDSKGNVLSERAENDL